LVVVVNLEMVVLEFHQALLVPLYLEAVVVVVPLLEELEAQGLEETVVEDLVLIQQEPLELQIPVEAVEDSLATEVRE
jgi:hypothetical protein